MERLSRRRITPLLLLVICTCCLDVVLTESTGKKMPEFQVKRGESKKSLSILMVSAPYPGHVIPMAAVGQTLVRRGHNVTLCSTEMEGSDLPRQLAVTSGMTFLSSGRYSSVEEFVKSHKALQGQTMFTNAAITISVERFSEVSKRNLRVLSQLSIPDAFDMVVVEFALAPSVACLAKQQNFSLIIFSMMGTDLIHYPPWPYPTLGSGLTDNLSFSGRLLLAFLQPLNRLLSKYLLQIMISNSDINCTGHLSYVYGMSGTYVPFIVTTVGGFDYPRPLLPMVHYVGPTIIESPHPLSDELRRWLASKEKGTVIYISMGSTAHLSHQAGKGIVEGILGTDYSAVWSLREGNRDILEGLPVDSSRFFISAWVSQQAILKHEAIAMAILHGGMGGIAEAIYNGVPIIVIPFALDQGDNALRVQHAGVGVYLELEQIYSKVVQKAIETVSSPQYKRAAEKLGKIFRHAGGANRAAELVEFYAEVGYDHLIPAYAKYNWSWVQYYNLDVYAVILLVLFLGLFCIWKCFTSLCNRCFRMKTKVE